MNEDKLREDVNFSLYVEQAKGIAINSRYDAYATTEMKLINLFNMFFESILSLPAMKELREKADALDIMEYGYPQEVERALETVRKKGMEAA